MNETTYIYIYLCIYVCENDLPHFVEMTNPNSSRTTQYILYTQIRTFNVYAKLFRIPVRTSLRTPLQRDEA